MNLNGTWKLYYSPEGSVPVDDVTALSKSGIPCVPCTVPGNVELDLSAAGVLPADLFKGKNIEQAQKYELYEWWYETEFTPAKPGAEEKVILHFGAVDCYADYYLNGELFGHSENMFISQDFDLTDKLRYDTPNTLHIHIHSTIIKGAQYPTELNLTMNNWNRPSFTSWVRKAPHSIGWDIMPRAVSAGLWREVELRYEPLYGVNYIHFETVALIKNQTDIKMCFDLRTKPEHIFSKMDVVIRGRCGDSTFEIRRRVTGCGGVCRFRVNDLKLWWPKHYGEPNLYTITVAFFKRDTDEKLFETQLTQGFRTLKLQRSDIVDQNNGFFYFEINGVKIMAFGTNWVPMDAYHSRDKARYQRALEMVDDLGCNIVRCWGGNVYEDHEFFDFCDRHGILVWQDFAMACIAYPQDSSFAKRLEEEAKWVIQNLRNHVCLSVWAGDNEIDSMLAGHGVDPATNHITREILPRLVERFDPARPYLPSSPYISSEAFRKGRAYYPEDHLWGPRDYFKSNFFTQSNACFVSETGYHGCPNRKSIETFIDPEYVWPYQDNPQWNLHSSDQNNNSNRTMLMHKQIAELFGEIPTDMDEFILASQISQAEAKKFFIERVRCNMQKMGGVIWWNLIDGWPQMSDAIVDYYYSKKLAYDYIKRSSRDFIITMSEMRDWGHDVICANNTLKTITGSCTIKDIDSEKTLFTANFTVEPNSNNSLGRLPLLYSEKGMLLIEWTVDGKSFFNTYLYGTPAFSLKKYKEWMKKLPETK